MRLVVYTDYSYHQIGGEVFSERAFSLFISEIAKAFARTTVLGRLDPEPARARYKLADAIEFVPLPHYGSLNQTASAVTGMARALRRIWRAIGTADRVWLLGPHPLALPIALMCLLRRCRLVLGIRQEFIEYVRMRHPGRRAYLVLATMLEIGFRALARFCPVIVVGPAIASVYRSAPSQLEISVSLVRTREIVSPQAATRDYQGDLRVLCVGRLDPEKNPLMLADVLATLRASDPRWHLDVCGEGSLEKALADRLETLGLASHATLHGYVPLDGGLRDLYLSSHVLLHVSWTEGLPQVLFEAFATALPIVATDVGGVGMVSPDALVLVPAGDPRAAADGLRTLADDAKLRHDMVEAGHRTIMSHSLESEALRTAAFLSECRTTGNRVEPK